MTFSEKIEDFVINKCGLSQEDVEDFENDGMWLSNAIIKYAYGRRKRRNGNLYIYHFGRCLSEYTRFVGIMQDIPCSVEISLLEEKGIPSPYAGIEETLILHDIIKDTDVTLDDLQEIFYRYGWQNTFDKTIGKALPILNDTSRRIFRQNTQRSRRRKQSFIRPLAETRCYYRVGIIIQYMRFRRTDFRTADIFFFNP